MKKRGQSLLENFLLLILVLGLVIPLLFYSVTKVSESNRINKADDALRTAMITGNAVRGMGRGNTNVLAISIPEGVKDSYSENGALYLIMNDGSELKIELDGEVIGSLPKEPGYHEVKVMSLDEGKVKFGKGPYIYNLGPSCLIYPLLGTDRAVIVGTDFDPKAKLYVDGTLMQGGYGVLTPQLIQFVYGNGTFPGIQNGSKMYYFQVRNPDGQWSNVKDSTEFFSGCDV
jgi:hypothetical protein